MTGPSLSMSTWVQTQVLVPGRLVRADIFYIAIPCYYRNNNCILHQRSTTIPVLVVRFISRVGVAFTAMVSVRQIHSVLQSVSANIVTVLIARCMTIGHARDATALQTEFDKK